MTTTTNKGLNLPARGDNLGTWDTPVNENWNLIDAAFGGSTTIQLSNSNVTLSPTQYKNAIIVLTSTAAGGLAANVTLTFPAVGSLYTIINQTNNSSSFVVTLATTVSGGEVICAPFGETVDILTDGTNVKYRNLGRVGEYWDHAGSSVPLWVTGCTVAPYLACDGTTFSSATFPTLATYLGGTTLPDQRGRFRASLNEGTSRLASSSGLDGDTLLASWTGANALSSVHIPPVPITDPGHDHNALLLNTGTPNAFGVANGATLSSTFSGARDVGYVSPATTDITAGSSSAIPFYAPPSAMIGGITMIRAG